MSTPSPEQSTTKGEFYFNRQIEIRGQSVNINKYGTIRLLDQIEIIKIYDGTETVVHKAQVQHVDEKQNMIVLDKPIPVNLGIASTQAEQAIQNQTKYYLRVPQTPLNPGRKYRVVVHALDREEAWFDVNRDSVVDSLDREVIIGRLDNTNLVFPNTADIANRENLLEPDNTITEEDVSAIEKKLEELRGQ
jgi:hypothetical protein